MKPRFFLLLLPLLLAGCEKNIPDSTDDTDIPGLPPITQTGANTFGCLVNGVPWTPAGPNNLSIDYDPGFKNGIVGIVAYRRILNGDNNLFVIAISDSLNEVALPHTYPIFRKSLAGAVFWDNNFCSRRSDDSTSYSNGHLHISKLDRTNRIIAGTFEVVLFTPDCGDTIYITKGRFDMGF